MTGFTLMGIMLILMGIILVLLGIIMMVGTNIPWIGRLPGDIIIKRNILAFTFPSPPVLSSVLS